MFSYGWTHLIFARTLWRRYYYYLYVTDEETGVQKSKATYPDQAARRRQNWDANSDSPVPESMLSSIPWFGAVDTQQRLIHPLSLFFLPYCSPIPACLHQLKKKKKVSCLVVSESANPWTVAQQASLSMGFSRQEYWSRLPFPPPGDHLDPGMEPMSPASCNAGRFINTEPLGKVQYLKCISL